MLLKLFLLLLSLRVKAAQKDSTILSCSPSNRHLFGKFLLQCWAKARNELGLSTPLNETDFKSDENRFIYKLAVERVVLKFFNLNMGVTIYYKKWQPIPYVKLYQCAETPIMETLYAISRYPKVKDSKGSHSKLSPAVTQSAKSQSHMRLLIAANPHLSSNESFESMKSHPKVFTFVSDPLERFYAGYQDSVLKLYFKTQPDAIINTTTIKQKIELILEHEQPLPATYQNLYPMSGAFFDFDLDIVGRTDTLIDDWNHKICPAYGLHCKKSRTSAAGSHDLVAWQLPSDRHAVRPALDALFSQEPKYLRAICYLLLVDYVCLPSYSLPVGCQYLNQTREAAQLALSKGDDIPIP